MSNPNNAKQEYLSDEMVEYIKNSTVYHKSLEALRQENPGSPDSVLLRKYGPALFKNAANILQDEFEASIGVSPGANPNTNTKGGNGGNNSHSKLPKYVIEAINNPVILGHPSGMWNADEKQKSYEAMQDIYRKYPNADTDLLHDQVDSFRRARTEDFWAFANKDNRDESLDKTVERYITQEDILGRDNDNVVEPVKNKVVTKTQSKIQKNRKPGSRVSQNNKNKTSGSPGWDTNNPFLWGPILGDMDATQKTQFEDHLTAEAKRTGINKESLRKEIVMAQTKRAQDFKKYYDAFGEFTNINEVYKGFRKAYKWDSKTNKFELSNADNNNEKKGDFIDGPLRKIPWDRANDKIASGSGEVPLKKTTGDKTANKIVVDSGDGPLRKTPWDRANDKIASGSGEVPLKKTTGDKISAKPVWNTSNPHLLGPIVGEMNDTEKSLFEVHLLKEAEKTGIDKEVLRKDILALQNQRKRAFSKYYGDSEELNPVEVLKKFEKEHEFNSNTGEFEVTNVAR